MNSKSDTHSLRDSDDLLIEARKCSEQWDMLTQNHDPAFQKWMRESFVRGYLRGYRACESDIRKL